MPWVAGPRGIKVGDGKRREPGELVPEAEGWGSNGRWGHIRRGEIVEVPEGAVGGSSPAAAKSEAPEPPRYAFEVPELLELMDPAQLKKLASRVGVSSKGLTRHQLIEALLAPPERGPAQPDAGPPPQEQEPEPQTEPERRGVSDDVQLQSERTDLPGPGAEPDRGHELERSPSGGRDH